MTDLEAEEQRKRVSRYDDLKHRQTLVEHAEQAFLLSHDGASTIKLSFTHPSGRYGMEMSVGKHEFMEWLGQLRTKIESELEAL